RGVNPCDFNMDGFADIYVSNYRLNPNFLWVNDGSGHFFNYAREYGVEGTRRYYGGSAYWGHTIGSEWADFDNDLDFDLFTANLAHPRFLAFSDLSKLYVNDGAPDYTFHDIFGSSGIIYQETHSEPSWGDIDNDGDLDLFITCVYEGRRSFMYRNDGDGIFTDITYETGLLVENGWGAAFSDYDKDGFIDLAVSSGGRIKIFKNKGNLNNYIEIRLKGVNCNRAAIGAIVKAYSQELWQMRYVEGGKGTSNQNSLVVHFGLKNKTLLDSLIIIWPGSGNVDKYNDIQANNFYIAEERRGLFITSIRNENQPEQIPLLELGNVYPNPFNKRFIFEYYIGMPSYVTLELYDVIGRKVDEIFSGFMPGGKGRLIWEAENNKELNSGLYFLAMRSKDRVVTKKVVYLK
ncbi:MAG: FG-GAP-like repeat-containing protein, partial [bacterium]